MFRLVTPNTGRFRLALLRNANKNHTGLKLGQQDYIRNNSSLTTETVNEKTAGSTEKPQSVSDATDFTEALRSLRYEQRKTIKDAQEVDNSTSSAIKSLSEMLKHDSVKKGLSRYLVSQYAAALSEAVFRNRFTRLSKIRNRDSDSYDNPVVLNDIILKEAILSLMDNVSSGQLSWDLSPLTVSKLIVSMGQYKAWSEIVNFWENGVNDERMSEVFLSDMVLAVVLPVAYDENKYSYDQILSLFNKRTEGRDMVDASLHTAIGKIAIKNGDYPRALDSMEELLNQLDSQSTTRMLRCMSDLHLAFIGYSNDLNILKHFFHKVIANDLPYNVALKTPQVTSLLDKMLATKKPFDEIFDIWKSTVGYYGRDNSGHSSINSRYSILNNHFLNIFFQVYPELTEEAHEQLRKIIATYVELKGVDEYFLNTLVSNYSWKDKTVFLQLLELYKIHQVRSTIITSRIILKKMGSVADFTASDIIDRWNRSLMVLDRAKYRYIPIADWAALRDSTILSEFVNLRKDLYLALLATYKDYHQDGKAVIRFVRNWMINPLGSTVARVSHEPENTFTVEEEINVPTFKHLRKNVDYKKLSEVLFKVRAVGQAQENKDTTEEVQSQTGLERDVKSLVVDVVKEVSGAINEVVNEESEKVNEINEVNDEDFQVREQKLEQEHDGKIEDKL